MAANVSSAGDVAVSIAGDDCLSIRDGRLFIEDAQATALAESFGTPLYVVSERQLRQNARVFVSVFRSAWPEGPVLVMPSIKSNFTLALRYILTAEGAGCDTFGAAELEAALRTGVDPEAISLNGSAKTSELIERAVKAGVRITLDSLAELDRVRVVARELGIPAKVRFRLRPWLEIEEPTELFVPAVSVRIATQNYKPGIPSEQLLELPAEVVDSPELDVRGVMAHIGRQGTDVRIWRELARWVGEFTGQLSERWRGWQPREIDLGGGFPVPRDPFAGAERQADQPRPRAPAPEQYAHALADGLRHGLERAGISPAGIQLEVEPGRSLYGNAGIHLARVLHVKKQREPIRHEWVETDSSEIFLADVVFERNRWTALVAGRADAPPTHTADIVGISCNPDVIVREASLPDVAAGDVIAFLDTGAYQDANASNFNALPRPATILVNGASAELIKRAETPADVFARDRVPARLRPREDRGLVVRGLDHVSVSCADLDRSLAFYSGLLGIPVRGRGEFQDGELRRISGIEDATVRWADLDLGAGQVLELLEYVTAEARPSRARFFDPGSGHLSLRVDDAGAAHAVLREAGVAVRSEPVELSEAGYWHGVRCFYTHDPDGVAVEIIERPGG